MRLLRRLLVGLGALTVPYFYFATVHPNNTLEEHAFFDAPEPWVIAHRGGLGLWPENTLYAFTQARALGVDVLEMDLRATADGELVVIHDDRVDRTTDGSGRVDELTLAEIRGLDAGYRFDDESGAFPHRGQGLAIPTLEEVLAAFPDSRLNLEMKGFSPELATKLCRTLSAKDALNRVLVASVGHDPMRALRTDCPMLATSATMREGLLLYQLNRMYLSSLYRSPAVALQTPEALGERPVIEPTLLEFADAYNVKIQVWTVNEEDDMNRLLDMGVQGIMTDYPDRLLRVLGRPLSATR